MRVGVNILNFGPHADPVRLLRWATTSESLGYHGIFVSDHIAVTPDVALRFPEPFYDPLGTLLWLAGQTSRVDLGTTVLVVPYRSPLLTARLTANLDQVSGGRLILGVGAGYRESEFAALGVPLSQRGALTDEYLDAIVALWTHGGPVTRHGDFIVFDDVAPMVPRREPRPPIWVGGMGRRALRRAARIGDGWHPILFSLDGVPAALGMLRRLAQEQGRPAPAFAPRIKFDIRDRRAGDSCPGVGTLDDIRSDLQELQGLGADYVVLDRFFGVEETRDDDTGLEQLARLAEEVLDLARETLRPR